MINDEKRGRKKKWLPSETKTASAITKVNQDHRYTE